MFNYLYHSFKLHLIIKTILKVKLQNNELLFRTTTELILCDTSKNLTEAGTTFVRLG
jgi:hypothetical protein